MPNMKVYLAGAFAPFKFKGKKYKDWRDFVRQEAAGKDFYDPREHSRQIFPATFTLDDAMGVLSCECFFHYRMRGYEDEGASWEHGIAISPGLLALLGNKLNVPEKLVIYADNTNFVWPLNFASSSANFSNLPSAVKFLREIKSSRKEDWLPLLYKFLDEDRRGS